MKTNTYHAMHQIEQVSVSVSSMLVQTKGHGRVHENMRYRTKLTCIIIYWIAVNNSKIANQL